MRFELFTNAIEVSKQLNKDAKSINKAMLFAMFRALSILDAEIKQNIRSRSGLRVRTGTLLNSIQQRIFLGIGIVKGEIGPQNVPYAAIHEFGGVIPARFVSPKRKKALRFFLAGGGVAFSKGHTIPAITIPARPYMAPAAASSADKIEEVFGIFIEDTLKLNARTL